MTDDFRCALVAQIPRLRAHALGLLGSSSAADDLVQDALVRAWRFRDGFEPGTNLNAWLIRILRNEFFTQLPRRRSTVEDIDGRLAEQVTCEPNQEWRVRYVELLSALPKLTVESRDALMLVAGSGFSYAEAAEMAGCGVNAMKQRVHRARRHLSALTGYEVGADVSPSPPPKMEARSKVAGRSSNGRGIAVAAAVALTMTADGTAMAQSPPAPVSAEQSARIEALLADQGRRLADQETRLQAQQARIDRLEAERGEMLNDLRAAGVPYVTRPGVRLAAADQVPNAVTELPARPLGEPATAPASEVTAIPASMNVLTPPGTLILDSSLEYVRTSNNRLVFRGVEIIPGLQLGLIEASDVARDTAVATVAARFGLTERLEVEARVPYVYRHDRLSLVAQTDPDFDRERSLSEDSIGDVEVAARYQLTSGVGGRPILVANARVKPPTGISPYSVNFDADGVATELATGSGFWSVEGGVTAIYPSEPAIIFGGLTYLHTFARDIDKDIGGIRVGRVKPGGAIGAQVGFGLSLNPRFSVSFGYSHNYIFPTKTELGPQFEKSRSLQAGSLLMGWSFRLLDRLTLNNSFEFGVTSDAPDMRVVLRAPYRF